MRMVLVKLGTPVNKQYWFILVINCRYLFYILNIIPSRLFPIIVDGYSSTQTLRRCISLCSFCRKRYTVSIANKLSLLLYPTTISCKLAFELIVRWQGIGTIGQIDTFESSFMFGCATEIERYTIYTREHTLIVYILWTSKSFTGRPSEIITGRMVSTNCWLVD